MPVTFNPSRSGFTQPVFGMDEMAQKRFKNKLSIEKKLMDLPMNHTLKIGDPLFFPEANFPLTGLDSLVEIKKISGESRDPDENRSCIYLISVPSPLSRQKISAGSLVHSRLEEIPGSTISRPGNFLDLASVTSMIRLPEHYGDL